MDAPLSAREIERRDALLRVVNEWALALGAVRTSFEFFFVVDRLLTSLEPYRSQLAEAVAGSGSLSEVSSAMERASERLSKLTESTPPRAKGG